MIVAFTGHRPERLLGRQDQVKDAIGEFLEKNRPSKVISGMARGVDLYAAMAALERSIPLIAAVPWKGHGMGSSLEMRAIYEGLLELASDVVITSPTETFHLGVYSIRNRYMVDSCDRLVTVWDGVEDGGTYDAIVYAQKVGREIVYLSWR